MVLDVAEDSFIFGEYVSHTGSSGTYLVIGHCQPTNPENDAGQTVGLVYTQASSLNWGIN